MKKPLSYLLPALILTGMISCKKVFNPHLNTVTTNFLAVDGPIISGDSTFITLSRTTSLSDTTQNKAELKATVAIEDDQAKLYPLTEQGKGKYVLGITNFITARKYRLNIKTTNGKIYQSDFVPMKISPPIDSIYFKQNGDTNVTFYVNAHDATDNTRYYRWDYKETWSVVPFYQAFYEYKNGAIVPIVTGSADDLTTCYKTDLSNQIFIGSSDKLANDVITDQPIGSLAAASEKIAHIYCMQLRQYALTADGFNYYQNLKTNTEQLGSIFDAQPSTLNGNIHCITSTTDVVIGFVSASTVTNRQYALHYNDIPLRVPAFYGGNFFLNLNSIYSGSTITANYFPNPSIYDCTLNSSGAFTTWFLSLEPGATFTTRINRALAKGDSLLIAPGPPGQTPTGYYYAPKQCVDCRFKGGTNIRPAYFPPY
jgi:hypothetical protein